MPWYVPVAGYYFYHQLECIIAPGINASEMVPGNPVFQMSKTTDSFEWALSLHWTYTLLDIPTSSKLQESLRLILMNKSAQ